MAQLGSMPPKRMHCAGSCNCLMCTSPNAERERSFTNGELIGCKYTLETAQCSAPNAMQFEVVSWQARAVWGRCCLTML